MSIYHAVLMLGGNDIGPRGEFQLSFVTFILIMAAIINANIFGNIAVLIQSLNRKAANFQEKMEYASETMKNIKLPESIQDSVKSYLTYTQSTLDHQKDLDTFLKMLSPSLKQEVSKHIFLDAIIHNPVFSKHENIIDGMIHSMTAKLTLPEEYVIRQGDVAKGKLKSTLITFLHYIGMFFIARGECDIMVIDENKVNKYAQTINTG